MVYNRQTCQQQKNVNSSGRSMTDRHIYNRQTAHLASSHIWKAFSKATWSLARLPAMFLCTQPSLRRSVGVMNGSGKVVLAAMVQIASPTL